jgi:hypothetical protein
VKLKRSGRRLLAKFKKVHGCNRGKSRFYRYVKSGVLSNVAKTPRIYREAGK